jgi:RNA polymerase sigma factor (sigma-70 family)
MRNGANFDPTSDEGGAQVILPKQFGADDASIEHIYLEHVVLLRRIAATRGVPEEDAKTLVQDVFLQFIGNPTAVRTNVRAYLVASICNASRNYWRSKRTEQRVFSNHDLADLQDSPKLAAEGFVEELALEMAIGATLARLPEREREVLLRRYKYGEDSETIAAALNTTPNNVDQLMFTGKKRARTEYQMITQVR